MEHHEELLSLLEAAVGKCPEGERAVAFSGGLDSSLVAYLSRNSGLVTLYTVGLEGSEDLIHAKAAAEEMRLPFRPIIITEKDIIAAIPEVAAIPTNRAPAPNVAIIVVNFFLLIRSPLI